MVTTLHSKQIENQNRPSTANFIAVLWRTQPALMRTVSTVADSGCTQRLLISLADAISYPAMSQSRHVRITTFLQPVKNEHLASVLPAFQR